MGIEGISTLKGLIARANKVMGKTVDTKNLNVERSSCGPRESFPTSNCMCIAVSKVYLRRAKFSENAKNKILKCINKKIKELGCDNNSTAVRKEFPKFVELSYKEKQLYSSEDFRTTKELVEASIKNPDMDLNFVDIIV